jgi:SOS response regulatory protein OraA/RecX
MDTVTAFGESLSRAVALLEERDRTITALRVELDARNYSESPEMTVLRRIPEEDCYRA